MTTVTRTQDSTSASVHSRAVTVAVVLLSAPAVVWGTILLVSVTANDPGLGGLAGSGVAEVLSLASIVGLIGAAGAAIVSRIAGGGPARATSDTEHPRLTEAGIRGDAPTAWFQERSIRRGPAALIAATAIAGGILIASVTGQLALGAGQSLEPAAPPAAPTVVVEETAEEPAVEPGFSFGGHTDH